MDRPPSPLAPAEMLLRRRRRPYRPDGYGSDGSDDGYGSGDDDGYAQTAAERRHDLGRLARVAAAVRRRVPSLVMRVADADAGWPDRWRVPVTVHGHDGAPVAVTSSTFEAVADAGGALVVEERFDPVQMNAFYVDVRKTYFTGWRAWSPAQRAVVVAAAVAAAVSGGALAAGWLAGAGA